MSLGLAFNEGFETPTTGYQNVWTATNQGSGGSEAIVSGGVLAGSATPSGWATQALRLIYAGGATRYIALGVSAPILYLSFDCVIGAESLADGQSGVLCLLTDASANFLALAQASQSAGVFFSAMSNYYDGSQHQVGSGISWPTAIRRRFEFYWDNTNNRCWARCDGRYQGTVQTLTGAAAARDVGVIYIGTPINADAAMTVYFDRIRLAVGGWPGYPIAPLVGGGSGYVGHHLLTGLGSLLS